MADDTSGWRFERGLDENFMEQLRVVAKSKERHWFADVLADPDLILGIRKNYVNVYRHGQSLFEIGRIGKTGPLKFSTHPKYLVDPDLYKRVPFDGSDFCVRKLKALLDVRRYQNVGADEARSQALSGG